MGQSIWSIGGGGGLDGFRADAEAYEAGEGSAEDGIGGEKAKSKGGLQLAGSTEGALEEAVGEDLEGLGDAGGEFASMLDGGED